MKIFGSFGAISRRRAAYRHQLAQFIADRLLLEIKRRHGMSAAGQPLQNQIVVGE
jgi:hypothetical protein